VLLVLLEDERFANNAANHRELGKGAHIARTKQK